MPAIPHIARSLSARLAPRRCSLHATGMLCRNAAWLLHAAYAQSAVSRHDAAGNREETGVKGPLLVMGSPPATVGVTRMSLPAALALGPDLWDDLLVHTASPSPFMSWAWHRAWADAAPAAEVDAGEVLTLHGMDGSLHALMPMRRSRVRFRRVWVQALTWAIGDIGCPDELDVPASRETDWSALATALDALPWQVLILSNLAEDAPHAEQLCAALVERGHAVRHSPLWSCPLLELPPTWHAYL